MKKYILLLSVLGLMTACSSDEKKEETTAPEAVETVAPVQTTTDSLEIQMDTLQSGVDSLLNKI